MASQRWLALRVWRDGTERLTWFTEADAVNFPRGFFEPHEAALRCAAMICARWRKNGPPMAERVAIVKLVQGKHSYTFRVEPGPYETGVVTRVPKGTLP